MAPSFSLFNASQSFDSLGEIPQYQVGSSMIGNGSNVTAVGPQGSFPESGPLSSFPGGGTMSLTGGGSMVISHQGMDEDVMIPTRSGSYRMQSCGSYGYPNGHNNGQQGGTGNSENHRRQRSDATNVLMLGMSSGMSPVNSFGMPFGTETSRDGGGRESPQPFGSLSASNSYGAPYNPSNSNGPNNDRTGENSRGHGSPNSPERGRGPADDIYSPRFSSPSRDPNAQRRGNCHNVVEGGSNSPYPIRGERYGDSIVSSPKQLGHSNDFDVPHFYIALRKTGKAFANCTFLLPGLRDYVSGDLNVNEETTNSTNRGNIPLTNSPSSERSLSHRSMRDHTPGSARKSGSANISIGNGVGQDFERQKAAFIPEPSNTPTRTTKPTPNRTEADMVIASRRVISAICAFGGTRMTPKRKPKIQSQQLNNNSIFRTKPSDDPSPSATHSGPEKTEEQLKYEAELPKRFYENDNHLSWEFEEYPPVSVVSESGSPRNNSNLGNDMMSEMDDDPFSPKRKSMSTPIDKQGKGGKRAKTESSSSVSPADVPSSSDTKNNIPQTPKSSTDTSSVTTPGGSDQPKMKYRCKLCGQPKQNHVCPYQQSLQRSIGTMVYPAVNAYTSDEPGELAAPLSEMNNFVSTAEMSSTETSPSRPSPSRSTLRHSTSSTPGGSSHKGPANVTPESLHSAMDQMGSPHHHHSRHRQYHNAHSPGSLGSINSSHSTPYRKSGPNSPDDPTLTPVHSSGLYSNASFRTKIQEQHGITRYYHRSKHLSSGGENAESDVYADPLFVETMELKQEQYRIVTPTKSITTGKSSDSGNFTYPALPLPYAQRKRLSDNLFSLSKEVPHLTDECAVVLREAREYDMWDQAVAELITQVITVIHCPDGDYRLNGLRQYLLTLGIAC